MRVAIVVACTHSDVYDKICNQMPYVVCNAYHFHSRPPVTVSVLPRSFRADYSISKGRRIQ